jgi:Tfp pilus assembly protein PilN
MKPLAIDFAPPSLARSWYRLGPRGWGLLALGVLLCGGAAVIGAQMLARQQALDAQLATVRASMNVPASAAAASAAKAAPPVAVGAAQAGAVNSAILQLNLPWPALRDAVQAATPPGVALLALEPDARRRNLKITAETRDADSMIAYVEQLKRQELFADVVLLRHEINETDPNRPLRFQVDAAWTNTGVAP